jgi:hypothetical protein
MQTTDATRPAAACQRKIARLSATFVESIQWIIRHNLFRRIRAPEGQLAGPAVLMWNRSRGTVVEGNTFIDCHRDISLGLVPAAPHDHEGGVLRNNVIVRTPGAGGDVAIAAFETL